MVLKYIKNKNYEAKRIEELAAEQPAVEMMEVENKQGFDIPKI